jgi:hypothetical protein
MLFLANGKAGRLFMGNLSMIRKVSAPRMTVKDLVRDNQPSLRRNLPILPLTGSARPRMLECKFLLNIVSKCGPTLHDRRLPLKAFSPLQRLPMQE